MYMNIHRDFKLNNELYYVVLRMVQLRDSYKKTGKGTQIQSVKYRGKELGTAKELTGLVLSECDINVVKRIAESIGYVRKKYIDNSQVVSKIDITLNNKDCSIRCLNYTDRALVNHSHRRKYEAVCNYIGESIKPLDKMINDYWICRKLGVFNEDCYSYTSLNPFLEHKEYLNKLLTFMAFTTFDYNKAGEDGFIAERIVNIIDYIDPWDENTWRIFTPINYFESIWKYLCFSMRDRKGMPTDEKLMLPENSDIRIWTEKIGGRYKGALHIRIKKFNPEIYEYGFKEQFETKYSEEIKEVKVNQGELDEYLVKLFLIDCREKKLPVPIGNKTEVVYSVGDKDKEYGVPEINLKWSEQSPKIIVFICKKINAGKASSFDKADVFVNHIGISVKSRRGAAPTIINQTGRDKILRVMKSLGEPIAPLDRIVDRYWAIRLNGGKEDVSNADEPNNPFCSDENGNSNIHILKPLLSYFAFRGTGTRESAAPAKYVLSVGIPDDVNTWVFYDESDFVDRLWKAFVFSIRSHGMPKKISDEMMPWVREAEGKKKGLLNVRIKKLEE